MSFFKKLFDKFQDLIGDDDKKKDDKKKEEEKEEDKHDGVKSNPSRGYTPHLKSDKIDNLCHRYQRPHLSRPTSTLQSSTPPQHGQHQSYGAPPPSHVTSTSLPPLPPGWIAQLDQNSQRYYYLEQATGRTQREFPPPSHGGFAPPGAPPMGSHGYDSCGQHGAPGGYYSQETKHIVEDAHGGGHSEKIEKKEKKSGNSGMLAAGAGGLAVGAVGGAMVGHAMADDSDEEGHHGAYQQQQSYGQQPGYYQEPAPPGPPPLEPPPPGDQDSVSSSDQEDLAEARDEYENASNASDREEAREEYEEAYEEAYD
ncbi:MAG: hypothetical protein Q9171_005519 [Xanthocarpia ochracea]